jgi:hypothetical protein
MELAYASRSRFDPDLSIIELPGSIPVEQHDDAAPHISKYNIQT